jgi:DNA (cytosine-5)-methyltransferase 1
MRGGKNSSATKLRVAGLFAGIGGVELGLHLAGHSTELLCEIMEPAQNVLRAHFPDIPLAADVRTLMDLPRVDLVTAGFPCQDLSQAGRTTGIRGSESGLVSEVFRILRKSKPRWLLLENVPFMLQLDRGEAMHYLTTCLQEHGYNWAYRVVDTRAFGLPQRRQRVLLLASPTEDPREVLLVDDAGEPDEYDRKKLNGFACGFYWTEGVRGLGWAVNAVPTLKGGSTIGIPSPPGIVLPSREIVTPEIRDAERMQGFPVDWTKPAVLDPKRRNGPRWKLVGNAVSVPVAKWVGTCLSNPRPYGALKDLPLGQGESWPMAAWCVGGRIHKANVSKWPKRYKQKPLSEFLKYTPRPLSARATAGFLKRTQSSSLCFPEGFLEAIQEHLEHMVREEEALR